MILYINCCVREESRTNKLAQAVLQQIDGEIVELNLYKENLRSLDRETLVKRTALIEKEDFSSSMFDYAKQFAAANEIVIAAPYWDLSFPAMLKIYFENMAKTVCRKVCVKRSGLYMLQQPEDRMTRHTATGMWKALQKTFSVFPIHSLSKQKCWMLKDTMQKKYLKKQFCR